MTTTTIVLRPFVRDYPGELVPEETFTHPRSWSSSNYMQWFGVKHVYRLKCTLYDMTRDTLFDVNNAFSLLPNLPSSVESLQVVPGIQKRTHEDNWTMHFVKLHGTHFNYVLACISDMFMYSNTGFARYHILPWTFAYCIFFLLFLVCCFSLYLCVCMYCIATTSWWIKTYLFVRARCLTSNFKALATRPNARGWGQNLGLKASLHLRP